MNRVVIVLRCLAVTVIVSALSACGTAPPATRHLLSPDGAASAAGNAMSDRTSPGRTAYVRLSQVRLPNYVSESAIAYQRADGTVGAASSELWAEDPQQAITHALGTALREVSGVTVIYEPWPVGLDVAGTISVSIHRLLGTLGSETRLSGQFLIVSPEQVLIARDFDFRETVNGADIPALLRSYARALRQLAEALAEALRASS